MSLDTKGEQIMTANEYTANTNPTIEQEMPFFSNSRGRKGATSAYAVLEIRVASKIY